MDGGIPLRSKLDAMKARLRDQTPAMRAIGEEIVLRTTDAFRARKSPAGEAWDALADSTLRARAAKLPGANRRGKTGRLTKGAQAKRAAGIVNPGAIAPLIDTGRLRASAGRYKAGRDSVVWSVVGYGGYHMGGSVKRPGRPPKRNFSVFERVGDRWAPIPAMRAYALDTVRRYVLTGALK